MSSKKYIPLILYKTNVYPVTRSSFLYTNTQTHTQMHSYILQTQHFLTVFFKLSAALYRHHLQAAVPEPALNLKSVFIVLVAVTRAT